MRSFSSTDDPFTAASAVDWFNDKEWKGCKLTVSLAVRAVRQCCFGCDLGACRCLQVLAVLVVLLHSAGAWFINVCARSFVAALIALICMLRLRPSPPSLTDFPPTHSVAPSSLASKWQVVGDFITLMHIHIIDTPSAQY